MGLKKFDSGIQRMNESCILGVVVGNSVKIKRLNEVWGFSGAF